MHIITVKTTIISFLNFLYNSSVIVASECGPRLTLGEFYGVDVSSGHDLSFGLDFFGFLIPPYMM